MPDPGPDFVSWTRAERERVITLRTSNPKKYTPKRLATETGIPVHTIKFWLDAARWAPKRKDPQKSTRLEFQDWESWRGAALRARFLLLKKKYPHHGDPPTRQELITWVRAAVKVCHYCKRMLTTKTFSTDHWLPVVRGGTSALNNLVPCCKHCNEVKESMTAGEFTELRALVATWEDGGKKLFARLRSGQTFFRRPLPAPV